MNARPQLRPPHLRLLVVLVLAALGMTAATFSGPEAASFSGPGCTWYVATGKGDAPGGSVEDPFGNIQAAIDAASAGDVVCLLPGTYRGPGNRDLNFRGKAMTLRSLDPVSEASIRDTVIDAEGQGVIVRFTHDEGPSSVFAGLTLLPGDTSQPVRGVPGYFEFSPGAHPTTTGLRLGKRPATQPGISDKFPSAQAQSAAEPPWGGRAWDGNDPFHQPAATTDYLGSGDVDNDGTLTAQDVLLAQKMVDEQATPNSRADADGDGAITAADVTLINNALYGTILPAWWNSLLGRNERNAWVTTILARDQTNAHPYYSDWYICHDFALQLFVRGAYCRTDMLTAPFDGGQTFYNIPLYFVNVADGHGYGHAINGILVGDDPLNFADWRFVEPQADYDVQPGMWDMPFGTNIAITTYDQPDGEAVSFSEKIVFSISESGGALLSHDPEVVLQRSQPPARLPDNRPDLWNPHLLPVGRGMLLFERASDDLSRITDIHLADLPLVSPSAGTPLIKDTLYSRLLDAALGPDGTVHLLWASQHDYDPGVFYARLDPRTRTITDVTRISSQAISVSEGRILVTASSEVHVFWLQVTTWSMTGGFYWSRLTDSGWTPQEEIAPSARYANYNSPTWVKRDLLRYYFDVALTAEGDPVVVWVEPPAYGATPNLLWRRYHEGWNAATIIDTDQVRGVALATDSTGLLHLAYGVGPPQGPLQDPPEGRGILLHRTTQGNQWSSPETVDASDGTCCMQMAAGSHGETNLVWERKIGDQVSLIWSQYADGKWGEQQVLPTRSGTEPWYPVVTVLPDSRVIFAWSSRANDLATVETTAIATPYEIYLPLLRCTAP